MNWNDLTAAWRRQPGETMPESRLEILRNTFDRKSRKLGRRLFWRDVRELVAGLFIAYVLVKEAIKKGVAGWPLWISVLLVLWVAVFFVRERIRAHRSRTEPSAPLLAKIEADIKELRRQGDLLLKVGTWYMAPLILGWFIALASTGFHGLNGSLRTPLQMGSYLAGSAVLFAGIWKLNQWVALKKIGPRIADLEELRNDLISNK
jgi:hypothetical protein